jgi:7,8-dihydropterin-6-yl-methyl-4-(beta-D-ribofuranosyl)aminobenzene 5'-phosphate synthase
VMEAQGSGFEGLARDVSERSGVDFGGHLPVWDPAVVVEDIQGLDDAITSGEAGTERTKDTIPEDMALVLDTAKRLVVVTGCGHAGVVNILEYARASVRQAPVHAVVGGLHLFPADEASLDWTAGRLKAMGVGHLLGAHCTGVEAVYSLRPKLGLERRICVVGAVGAGFDLEAGIRPGTIAR